MNCYFCNQEATQSSPESLVNYECLSCPQGNLYDGAVERVITSYIDRTEPASRAHMFLFVNKHEFQVRLNIVANNTDIICWSPHLELTIPGIALNPINVIKKVKIYLLFS
jgi:hypothetical protein